jgi:hypothetical protein
MSLSDPRLERLLALARRREPLPAAPPPPWFAQRVVQRWLAEEPAGARPGSWSRVSRRGLAWAGAAMVVSLAVNVHVWWHPDSPERLASESVIHFVLPR